MTYKTLSDMAQFTNRTHDMIAEVPISKVFEVFESIQMEFDSNDAVVGITVVAATKPAYGGLNTHITISKLDNGEWNYSEQVVA